MPIYKVSGVYHLVRYIIKCNAENTRYKCRKQLVPLDRLHRVFPHYVLKKSSEKTSLQPPIAVRSRLEVLSTIQELGDVALKSFIVDVTRNTAFQQVPQALDGVGVDVRVQRIYEV